MSKRLREAIAIEQIRTQEGIRRAAMEEVVKTQVRMSMPESTNQKIEVNLNDNGNSRSDDLMDSSFTECVIGDEYDHV